jgi:hypothetical protein
MTGCACHLGDVCSPARRIFSVSMWVGACMNRLTLGVLLPLFCPSSSEHLDDMEFHALQRDFMPLATIC